MYVTIALTVSKELLTPLPFHTYGIMKGTDNSIVVGHFPLS